MKKGREGESAFYVGPVPHRITAKGKERRAYAKRDQRDNPAAKLRRDMAARMLKDAFLDYHNSRRVIRQRNITMANWSKQTSYAQESVYLGKEAYSWVMNEPMPNQKDGTYTFKECCNLLGLNYQRTKEQFCHTLTFDRYKNMRSPGFEYTHLMLEAA